MIESCVFTTLILGNTSNFEELLNFKLISFIFLNPKPPYNVGKPNEQTCSKPDEREAIYEAISFEM